MAKQAANRDLFEGKTRLRETEILEICCHRGIQVDQPLLIEAEHTPGGDRLGNRLHPQGRFHGQPSAVLQIRVAKSLRPHDSSILDKGQTDPWNLVFFH